MMKKINKFLISKMLRDILIIFLIALFFIVIFISFEAYTYRKKQQKEIQKFEIEIKRYEEILKNREKTKIEIYKKHGNFIKYQTYLRNGK